MALKVFSKEFSNLTFEVWNDLPEIDNLFTIDQIHSDIYIKTSSSSKIEKGDAIISQEEEYILAIKTADCVPLAIKGQNGIALIHAGWKGIQSEILLKQELKDIRPKHVIIGPHIRVKNYEVGADFKKNFPNSTNFEEINGKICFNMLNTVIEQLSSTYPGIIIEDCNLDTFEEEKLRSYRNGDLKKRNWNILKYT